MPTCTRRAVVTALCFSPWLARADEVSDARAVATAFRRAVTEQRFDEAYDDLLADAFKRKLPMTRSEYIQTLRNGQKTVGRTKSTTDLSYTYADHDPATGYRGKIYMFDYKTVYEKGAFFERLVVIREAGKYRIGGVWSNPAPL